MPHHALHICHCSCTLSLEGVQEEGGSAIEERAGGGCVWAWGGALPGCHTAWSSLGGFMAEPHL